ncbi:Response regulator receiver domain protein [compost metagenome]
MNEMWEELLPTEGEVVVIEGDPTLRALMKEVLVEAGLKSSIFETPETALAHLLRLDGECPLVIVDYALRGDIRGTDFIEMIRGKWPAIAVILTSGQLLHPAMLPPSTIYVFKPWSLDDLLCSIAMLIRPGHFIRKV